MLNNIIEILVISLIILPIVLTLIISFECKNSKNKKGIILFYVAIVIYTISYFPCSHGYFGVNVFFTNCFPLIYFRIFTVPLFYLSLVLILHDKNTYDNKLPFAVVYPVFLSILFYLGADSLFYTGFKIFGNIPFSKSFHEDLYNLVVALFSLPMMLLALLKISTYRLAIKNKFSSINSNYRLKFVSDYIEGYSLLLVVNIILSLIRIVFGAKTIEYSLFVLLQLVSLIVISIYFFLNRRVLYSLPVYLSEEDESEKSHVSHNTEHYYLLLLNKKMQNEKPFLNAELQINDLAGLLQVDKTVLLRIIKAINSKSFYNYINEYRVEEAKDIIEKLENNSIIPIDLYRQCGFSSVEELNNWFKKATGVLPDKYLSQLKSKSKIMIN